MYDVLIEQQDNYWATITTIYSDEALLFYTYLRYCKWRLDNGKLLDSESFNEFLCIEQNNVFRNMKW